jgi:hypothetical protein
MNNDRVNRFSLLEALRLPARLNTEQVAQVAGFQPHDIPLLVRAGLLKPLGGGPRNSVKFFAAIEVEELCRDRKWLDRATKAVSRRKKIECQNATESQPTSLPDLGGEGLRRSLVQEIQPPANAHWNQKG